MKQAEKLHHNKELLKGILTLIKNNDLDITLEEILYISDTNRLQKKYRAIFWNTKSKEPIYKNFHNLPHLINFFKKFYNLSDEDLLNA